MSEFERDIREREKQIQVMRTEMTAIQNSEKMTSEQLTKEQ